MSPAPGAINRAYFEVWANNFSSKFHRMIFEKIEFKVIFFTDVRPTLRMPRSLRRVITLRGLEAILDSSPALRVI